MGLCLVLSTVLIQAAVGMTLILRLTDIIPGWKNPRLARKTVWRWILGMTAAGLAAFLIYAGGPPDAQQALRQTHTQWAWMEWLLFSAFFVLAAAAYAGISALATPALICGVGGIVASGAACAISTRPFIRNVLPLLFFILTTTTLGAAFGLSFPARKGRKQLRRILTGMLILTFAVFIAVPPIWGTGGEMMRVAALAWIFSPLFWTFIALGLLVPLFLVVGLRSLPHWAAWLMLLAAIAGRAQLFLATPNGGGLFRFPL